MQTSNRFGIALLAIIGLLVGCGRVHAACTPNNSANRQILASTSSPLERARCLYFLGSYEEAWRATNALIAREPNEADAYLIRGRSEKMLEQIPRAMSDFDKSIKLRPNVEAYYSRGITFLKDYKNRQREAIADFSKVIQMDPKYLGAYMGRGMAYAELDDFKSAYPDTLMVVKLNPDAPNAFCNVGLAQMALGNDVVGRRNLENCYRFDPDPQTRGYYEYQVNNVMAARRPRNAGGSGSFGGSVQSPLDADREKQQWRVDALRQQGLDGQADACRNDQNKC